MTSEIDLELRGPMDHLRIAWQAGEALLEGVPFEEDPEGSRYNVLLAVQEMVTNILRHGYQGNEQVPLRVTYRADLRGIEILLRDKGPAFDPLCTPTTRVPGEELPPEGGGYGIMIMRAVMDDVAYERDDGWNVLRMYKSAQRTPVTAHRG